jgi:uncharacterized membrane protein YcaP (DUF421 family)
MQKAKITLDEIQETIREHGVATIKEVDLAVLEMDGNISVLSNEFKHGPCGNVKCGEWEL